MNTLISKIACLTVLLALFAQPAILPQGIEHATFAQSTT